MVLDGKTFAEATMVIALGITMAGEKRFLGFVETDTENEKVLTPFLRSLVERGLDVSQGVLVILDGGKGLRSAVRKAFRDRALVHRCQWHKRENVVSYLAKIGVLLDVLSVKVALGLWAFMCRWVCSFGYERRDEADDNDIESRM